MFSPHCHVGKERIVLEDRVDFALVGGQRRNILSVQQDSSAVRTFEARQDAEQRGFAAPAGTQQGKKLPFPDRKRDIVRGPRCSEMLGEVFENQKIRQPSPSPIRPGPY